MRQNSVQSKSPSFYCDCSDSGRQDNSSWYILCTLRHIAVIVQVYILHFCQFMTHKVTIWHTSVGATEIAGQENAGLENAGQSCRGGKCRTGKWRIKVQGWKMQDWKMTDKFAGLENAGLEIDGQKLQGVENDGHTIEGYLMPICTCIIHGPCRPTFELIQLIRVIRHKVAS